MVPSVGTATPPAQVVIHITAPAANDVWKIGTAHSIAWTEAPNFTGYIYLIDAGTKNLVGSSFLRWGRNRRHIMEPGILP